MELLYYWIDEDKTYKEQGFHLSNRFSFEFERLKDQKTAILKIAQNEEHQAHFFGNHIINLTAVIGENGSGKTNLMFDLIGKLTGYQHVYGYGYLLAFYDSESDTIIIKESLRSNTYLSDLRVDTQIKYRVVKVEDGNRMFNTHYDPQMPERTGLIYFNPIYDLRDYPFKNENRDFADVSSTYLIWKDGKNRNIADHDMVEAHKSQEIFRQFRITQSPFLKGLDIIDEIRIPNEIEVEILKTNRIEKSDLGSNAHTLYDVLRKYGSKVLGKHEDILYKIDRSETKDSKSKRNLERKEKAKTWLLINFLDHFFYCLADTKDLNDKFIPFSIDDFPFFKKNKIVNYDKWNDWKSMEIEEYRSIVSTFFNKQEYLKKTDFDINTSLKNLFNIIDESADVTEDNKASFNFGIKTAFQFSAICDKYGRAFKNEYNQGFTRAQWRNISSGELAYLNLFSRIFLGHTQLLDYYDESQKAPPSTIYLLIDEGEHGMHPQWQKKFVEVLLRFLQSFEGIKFQIIVTSHSPIILSDVPKSNILFLNKGEYTSVYVRQQETFGANIHTLFRDSFFMKNGLIGEFASQKINQIVIQVKYFDKNKDSFDEVFRLIQLIGEPILRRTLEKELSKKVDDDRKIWLLEKEIERIKSEKSN